MRRGHHCNSVFLRFFKSERYIADYARIGVQEQGRLYLLRETKEELGFPRLARKLRIVSHNFYARR